MHDDQPLAQDNSAPLVLLIDDAEDLRTVVADFLQSSGFRVETAKNGFQGVTRAVESVPDIILMDLGMPGMDGLETARLLKKQSLTSSVPIVAFTGQTLVDDMGRVRACGFTELISKPHDLSELADALRRILKDKSSRDAEAANPH
jgi:CheY-like chemotaxis protein